jgi:hypothetical protein
MVGQEALEWGQYVYCQRILQLNLRISTPWQVIFLIW